MVMNLVRMTVMDLALALWEVRAAASLVEALQESETKPSVRIINESSFHLDRNQSYVDMIAEKNLSIKGYMYKLWCLARAAGIRYCVLHYLLRRFERPDSRNRWDSPLFELWSSRDGIENSSAAIVDAIMYLTKKVDSKTRDVKVLQPTIATQNARITKATSLYKMDRATHEVGPTPCEMWNIVSCCML
ncbi:unnamed protein product [Fraxinus pennsylvanica]|uniref:Uncharacterized protein n=1 Tax=Fraxinus pennsylvanica TaxID=56036 RepID=A0AAD2DYT2_9LAMI|nr:unnamed protein product [Fraxinus pennsylvanica]